MTILGKCHPNHATAASDKNLRVSSISPPISVVPQPYTQAVSPVKSTPDSGRQAGVYTWLAHLVIENQP